MGLTVVFQPKETPIRSFFDKVRPLTNRGGRVRNVVRKIQVLPYPFLQSTLHVHGEVDEHTLSRGNCKPDLDMDDARIDECL